MRALITGVSGQDGYHMAQLLLSSGYEVLGLTSNLAKASLVFAAPSFATICLSEFDYRKPDEIGRALSEFEPDLIFNFAALASGRGMFDSSQEMVELNGVFVGNLLEAIRLSPRNDHISFCQASSSEMFGNVEICPQTEDTPFNPKSPYGAAKLLAHNLVKIYRETYGIRCCSAVLFNHESIRRPENFVTRKIATAAAKIKLGLVGQFSLGNLGAKRDWGYAPEYVQAMHLMALAPQSCDYIVASGTLKSVQYLCEVAFGHVGLDYRKYLKVESQNLRPIESKNLCGDANKIARDLGWRANRSIDAVMVEMVEFELGSAQVQNVEPAKS